MSSIHTCKIGVVYLAWPQSQTKPDGETNRAVLNQNDIRIVKVEQVEVDDKNRLIEQLEYMESKARTEQWLQKLPEKPLLDDN